MISLKLVPLPALFQPGPNSSPSQSSLHKPLHTRTLQSFRNVWLALCSTVWAEEVPYHRRILSNPFPTYLSEFYVFLKCSVCFRGDKSFIFFVCSSVDNQLSSYNSSLPLYRNYVLQVQIIPGTKPYPR